MRLDAADVGNKADAAGIVFVGGIVQPASGGGLEG
jgi:hypothetical protein